MKQNKGIALIALVITIIVLLILAGVTIAMLSGNNGILNRANESKYDNIISSVDEQAKLAQLGVRTAITANMTNKAGYIATKADNFTLLVNEVAGQVGVATSAVNATNDEGYAVYKYLNAGDASTNGTGYILITYTNNALRSSLPSSLSLTSGNDWEVIGGVAHKAAFDGTFSRNQASLAYVIKVSNYKSELSKGMITTTTTVGNAKTAATTGTATAFESTTLRTQSGVALNSTSGS